MRGRPAVQRAAQYREVQQHSAQPVSTRSSGKRKFTAIVASAATCMTGLLTGAATAHAEPWDQRAGAYHEARKTIEEGPVVDSAGFVENARSQLQQWGIQTPELDREITDAIDQQIASALPQHRSPQKHRSSQGPQASASGIGAASGDKAPASVDKVPAAETRGDHAVDGNGSVGKDYASNDYDGIGERPAIIENPAIDPNMRWVNDPLSKILAGKPTEDFVLHRVPGSWFDAPRIPEESNEYLSQGTSLYGPGTPLFVGDSGICTLAVAGTDAQGHKVGITAGHCGAEGDYVASADSWQVGNSGTIVASNAHHDYSVIEFGSNAEVTRSYNNVTVDEIGAGPRFGDQVCKNGVATGHTCGVHYGDAEGIQFNQVCASLGDSGGPLLVGNRLVGIISGGANPTGLDLSCRSPLQGFLHVPTMASDANTILADLDAHGGVGAGFQLPEN
ncbi:S1 family peptidase [Corynebacterium propinquum]|uniref:S1 family peptidase n=1 Tax=Corynebacterium propinquum TaxID=43769 RepID=UPI002541DD64|nr:S1 family peptidase [Corynebacterium propinquum]MDK4258701.1 S1 family peptidase [Corynebacterium propinquum]MDK4281541.1 S1 family peptidase [Corynebacterium propinquum]MDK4299493.1 S1 family peptidase [Corynebacterium propinquum]